MKIRPAFWNNSQKLGFRSNMGILMSTMFKMRFSHLLINLVILALQAHFFSNTIKLKLK